MRGVRAGLRKGQRRRRGPRRRCGRRCESQRLATAGADGEDLQAMLLGDGKLTLGVEDEAVVALADAGFGEMIEEQMRARLANRRAVQPDLDAEMRVRPLGV